MFITSATTYANLFFHLSFVSATDRGEINHQLIDIRISEHRAQRQSTIRVNIISLRLAIHPTLCLLSNPHLCAACRWYVGLRRTSNHIH